MKESANYAFIDPYDAEEPEVDHDDFFNDLPVIILSISKECMLDTCCRQNETGSGKTHTMGTCSTNGIDDENIGIVPRVF